MSREYPEDAYVDPFTLRAVAESALDSDMLGGMSADVVIRVARAELARAGRRLRLSHPMATAALAVADLVLARVADDVTRRAEAYPSAKMMTAHCALQLMTAHTMPQGPPADPEALARILAPLVKLRMRVGRAGESR